MRSMTTEYHTVCKRRAIDFDPDFEAMKAFVIEVPDGTPVRCDGTGGDEYVWRKGQITNKNDGSVRQMPTKKIPLVSVGKPLPKLEDLKLSSEQIQNKPLLVCFFDVEQRPSRNCIMRLARQARQLKQEGVTVVAVQASEIDEDTLNEWTKEYNIPFPIGIVQDDEMKTHFDWGIKALPWFILTDCEHEVVAEGFALQELNDKLKTD